MTLRRVALILATVLAGGTTTTEVRAQATARALIDVPGQVVDLATSRGIPDVLLRIVGTDVSAATDAGGRFVLRGVPEGTWTLRVDHLGYGSHEHRIAVAEAQAVEIQIRLAAEAIELEPIVVEGERTQTRAERAQGSSLHVVTRPEIERALGTSKHLGDLIRQTIPGLRLRQTNNLAGTDVCLEFRAAATISMLQTRACNHPMVLVDGVPVSNPNYLYGTIGLSNIERIQMIPPGEAGVRYGSGSLYGVLLIDTRAPGRVPTDEDLRASPVPLRGNTTFDWSQDPEGHHLLRSSTASFLGNAVGLAAGIAVGGHCIGVDRRDQIVTTCGPAGNVAAAVAALLLPATGAALGARWGGRTEASRGRIVPAILGAGMMLFPGYAFSMSTVGGGSDTANMVGAALLAVGTPALVTLTDRLFRTLR
jgi:hypothetical protein